MEERLTAMRTPLSLSDAQVAQIRAIFQEGLAQVRAELAAHPEPGEARRDALRRIHFTMDDRVHSLLSCEQREALRQFRREHRAEHRAERMERRREHRGGRGAGAGVDRGI
jgi:Spy/CpxP family protein refolding chaperone